MKYILLSIVLLVIGCTKEPKEVQDSSNREYKISFLFEHDGCKVYRFTDWYTVYFTNCGGTEHTETCGKGCLRKVQTIKR